MFESFLMGAAFAAGQAPYPAPMPAPPAAVRVQATAPAPMRIQAAAPAPMPAPPGAAVPAAPAYAPAAPTYTPGAPTYAPGTPDIITNPPADSTGDVKEDREKAEEEKKEEPTYFFMNLFADRPVGQWMKDKNIHVYGWTEVSYNGSTASRSNAPIFMDDQANQWQMNQNYLHLDKSIDTSKKEFQLGGTADLILPGTDARTTISRDLLSRQLRDSPNGLAREYPIDLFQAYGEVFLPGLGDNGTAVKIGKFATFLEYELVQAPLTPFLSRSFLFQYNPFTHTGVLATTQLSDAVTVANGVVGGNDNFIGDTFRPTYLGMVRWAPKDGKNAVQFGTSVTDPRFSPSRNYNYYNVYNLQWTHVLSDALTYQLDTSYSHTYNVPGLNFTDWYGAVQYLFWKHSDKLTSNFRFELFEDSDGYRTGTRGLYTSPTYGLTYTPLNWLLLRPSVQYAYNPNRPWEGDKSVWIGAMDMIVRW